MLGASWAADPCLVPSPPRWPTSAQHATARQQEAAVIGRYVARRSKHTYGCGMGVDNGGWRLLSTAPRRRGGQIDGECGGEVDSASGEVDPADGEVNLAVCHGSWLPLRLALVTGEEP